jgi:hypothetical protein
MEHINSSIGVFIGGRLAENFGKARKELQWEKSF